MWRSVRFRHRRTWDQRTHEEDGEGEAEERKSAKSTAEPKNTPPPLSRRRASRGQRNVFTSAIRAEASTTNQG